MKKIIFLISFLMSSLVLGQETRAVDITQPSPSSTINKTTVKHTINTIDKNGQTTVTKTTSLPNKVTIEYAADPQYLPPPTRVDDLDLEETMKKIGRAFRDLKAAQTTAKMTEPVKIMASYAGQAQIIGLVGATNALQQQYVDEMQTLREEIAKLQALIILEDLEGAKDQVKHLDQMRRNGHRAFKNY